MGRGGRRLQEKEGMEWEKKGREGKGRVGEISPLRSFLEIGAYALDSAKFWVVLNSSETPVCIFVKTT